MKIESYENYQKIRDNIIKASVDGEITAEEAGNRIAIIDTSNKEFFEKAMDESANNALSLYNRCFIDSEALEQALDNIQEYAEAVLQPDDTLEKELALINETVTDMKKDLYRKCADGYITESEREDLIQNLSDTASQCTTLDDLSERLGLVSEGFIDATKTKFGKISRNKMTIIFNGKTINARVVVKAGTDLKSFKEKNNGINLDGGKKLAKDVAILIRKDCDTLSSGSKPRVQNIFNRYKELDDNAILKSLKVKYITIGGSDIEVTCGHPVSSMPNKPIIKVSFDFKGGYIGVKSGIDKSIKESVDGIDLSYNDIDDLPDDAFDIDHWFESAEQEPEAISLSDQLGRIEGDYGYDDMDFDLMNDEDSFF